MTTPSPPAIGDTVALRGLTSTTLLRAREVKNFIWSTFYAAYVAQGYAELYSGPSGGTAPAAFYVKSVNGTRPNADGNVTVAGGSVTNPAVAALVAAAGETRAAVDARIKAVGDTSYAPVSPTTGITYNPDGSVATVTENGITTTYTYNPDGTVKTDSRAGVTRTYTYDGSGNLTGIAS